MPARPFRFVHAAAFHLETPLHGLGEIPGHLRSLLIDAPYAAARRVFDTAINEGAELLVLAGNLVHPRRAGLPGPVFLVEQFQRLAERGVAVYWIGGQVDPPEAWPAAFPLPDNVHVFPGSRPVELLHQRDGLPLVRVVGQSYDPRRPIAVEQFTPDPAGLFTIGLAHGDLDPATVADRGIHYWALGGRSERTTLCQMPAWVHDPGTPQGRCPRDLGPHGCSLVHVDERGQARVMPLDTDVVRWVQERVTIDESTDRDALAGLLAERMQSLVETSPKMDLLVSWTVAGTGPLLVPLRHGGLATGLLSGLRNQYGAGSPAAWSVSLEVEATEALPATLYEQETILGDFLRAVQHLEVNPDEPLGMDEYLPEAQRGDGGLRWATLHDDPAARQRVLQEAARLGAELLGGGQQTDIPQDTKK